MQVRLFGAMEVVDAEGEPLAVPGQKTRALLAMLALDAGRPVATDRLVDALWHDDAPADVANSLQRLVSKLRRSLGSAEAVAMRPGGYVLTIPADDVDVHRMERFAADGRAAVDAGDLETAATRFAEAEALWVGAPLAEFTYVEFAHAHVARLVELRLSLVEARVDVELALGRHHQLVTDLEALVDEHPLRERLRGQLMLTLYRSGRQADALRVLSDGRALLAEELGLDPGPELRQLEIAILNHDPSLEVLVESKLAPPVERSPRRANVRPSLTELIGRGDELIELQRLRAAHRLVTIVGPGGAGKTRLAGELARRAIEAADGDVVMVELAAVRDERAVAAALAAAFELRDPDSDPLDRLGEALGTRDVLLVLDNCEHLVGAAAVVAAALLERCHALRIVATSREALRVPGEIVWVVPPLAGDDGVELFVERATAANPAFAADDEARTVIGQIRARLDGLPLAIELAAARSRAFTVWQIADRLDDRFRLLSGGSRTAMARQQTLRAVVDWSYDLLFDQERRVFERLAVFPAGCTLDGAEAVCASEQIDPADVLDLVAGLVDKSLLVAEHHGPQTRFSMLQTLRHYGRERLVERGDADDAYRKMATHLAELCAPGRVAWRGIRQREWFEAVGRELDGIRTGFEWAVGAGDKQLAVSIAADLGFGRWVGGGTAEGVRWLDEALALPGDVDPFTAGWAGFWRVFLGFVRGERNRTAERFDDAIALVEQHADPLFVAYVLSFEAQLVDAMGRRAEAIELNHRLLGVLARSTDPWARPAAAWTRASLAVQEHGDFAAFEAGLREARMLYRDVGDQFMTAVCLDLLAELAEQRGDLDAAIAGLTEALAIVSGWQMASFEAGLLARMARAAVGRGDDGARLLVDRALARSDDLVFRPGRAIALAAMADLQRRAGRLDDAEPAASAALTLYREAMPLRFTSSFSRAPTAFDVPAGAAAALSVLGFVAEARGDTGMAIDHHRSAYREVAALPHPRMMALALEGLAAALLPAGRPDAAAHMLGCAGRLRAEFDAGASPTELADIRRIEAALVAEMGGQAAAAATLVGAGMPPDQLVATISDQT